MATLPGKWSTVHNDRDTYMYMVNVPTHVQVHVHALVHVQCSFWCNMPSILIFLCCGNEAGLIKALMWLQTPPKTHPPNTSYSWFEKDTDIVTFLDAYMYLVLHDLSISLNE